MKTKIETLKAEIAERQAELKKLETSQESETNQIDELTTKLLR